MIQWSSLSSLSQLDEISALSFEQPILIFKHSTTCPISSMSKMRLEENWTSDKIKTYYLDLLSFRNVSNEIADRFQVHHESPQVLLIVDGDCIYENSHLDISAEEILESLQFYEASNG